MDTTKIANLATAIGVFLTFAATIFTAKYAKKSVKISKYIETVTIERIKWLGIIRDEVSDLYSELVLYLDRAKEYDKLVNERQELSEALTRPVEYMDPKDPLKQNYYSVTEQIYKLNEEICSREKKLYFTKRAYLLILRLNPDEDQDIIDQLKLIKKIIITGNLCKQNIDLCLDAMERIIEMCQRVLKNDWEKVKKETIKGSSINNSLIRYVKKLWKLYF